MSVISSAVIVIKLPSATIDIPLIVVAILAENRIKDYFRDTCSD